MVPLDYRVSAMSYGWMFIWFIGGNSTLLSPIIGEAFNSDSVVSDGTGLRVALLMLYFGGMGLAAAFFVLATILFWRKHKYGNKHEPSRSSEDDTVTTAPFLTPKPESGVVVTDKLNSDHGEAGIDSRTKHDQESSSDFHVKAQQIPKTLKEFV